MAGSSYRCECNKQLEVPSLRNLQEYPIVPEPSNRTIEKIDPKSLSCDNEQYVLLHYEPEYQLFCKTRSKTDLFQALECHPLDNFQREQVYDIFDQHYRQTKRKEGWKGVVIGLVTIPFLSLVLLIALVLSFRLRLLFVIVFALLCVTGIFFRGWYYLLQSKSPHKL
jgi:hypothetical protein